MGFLIEVLTQIVVLFVSGTVFAFFIWKLLRGKKDFGEFVNKYGEMLAYGGLLFIVLIIGLIQWYTG